MHKIPFDRSYWVTPCKFLAGYYPGDRDSSVIEQKMRDLLDCGIRCTINLMETDETDHDGRPFRNYEPILKKLADGNFPVSCHRMPIVDLGVPTKDLMIQILDRIDTSLNDDRPVYIHCWGGRGRTGTVVGCWLIRHGIVDAEMALEKIQELRRSDPKSHWPSPEMPALVRMVLSWQKGE